MPRIALPAASLGTEALHGLGIAANPNAPAGSFMPVSTQFPQAFGLGESWDPEVDEDRRRDDRLRGARLQRARRQRTGPRRRRRHRARRKVDLVRDPRWGRTEESYGEDPYLVGELAKGYMAGLHGTDPTYLLAASR